jgi:hypothetical protein
MFGILAMAQNISHHFQAVHESLAPWPLIPVDSIQEQNVSFLKY